MNFPGTGRGALLRAIFENSSIGLHSKTLEKSENNDSGIAVTSNVSQFNERDSSLLNERRPAGRGHGEILPSSTSGISGGSGRGRFFEPRIPSTKSTDAIQNDVVAKMKLLQINEPVATLDQTISTEQKTEIPETVAEPVIRMGNHGTQIKAICNYIQLQSEPDKGVFEYEVKFDPNVDSRNLRFKYLNQHQMHFGGTKTFDGANLYLPILLPQRITTFISKDINDSSPIKVILIYKRRKPLRDCMNLYNILFDRIMKSLNYVRFDRKQFDPSAPKVIPQHKLEVWPGYVTSVDEFEGGLMLCCDVSHRVLCKRTVLDVLTESQLADKMAFQENAKRAIIGTVIITPYNNKHYRIDDIDFNSNPLSQFEIGQEKISFVDYYRRHYNIQIKDLKQPLLTSFKRQRVNTSINSEEVIFSLIPELCNLCGLTDAMRSNFKVMRDLAMYTKVTPNQRLLALRKFIKNINGNPETKEILNNWGLTLADDVVKMTGRDLGIEEVIFETKKISVGPTAEFSKHAVANELLEAINFSNWLLIFTNQNRRIATTFMEYLERNSSPMGIEVCKPKTIILNNDRNEDYINAIKQNVTHTTQIVVVICPTSREDRYCSIKKLCCVDLAVPSQIINANTLSKTDVKTRSIVQKIALQMNCKLGGTLWSIRIPFKNVMICGIDTFHDAARKNNSVSALVASLNAQYTKWFSKAIIQTKGEEIVNGLCAAMQHALAQYKKCNGVLPEKIIIYRDGVGDGQLKIVSNYELPQLKAACETYSSAYEPHLAFIVVQKRINTRIFIDDREGGVKNPNPGMVIDHRITRRYLYDFFLISQSVREGTASPCHFIVLQDTFNHSPDILQRLSYKLCFLYYNWAGALRVPACCQYAHKLAFLVGQNIRKTPSDKLADRLYYL